MLNHGRLWRVNDSVRANSMKIRGKRETIGDTLRRLTHKSITKIQNVRARSAFSHTDTLLARCRGGDQSVAELKLSLSRLKIALVKPVVQANLYCCGSDSSASDVVASSLKHTGPAGLIASSDVSFFIVDIDLSPECQTWREKVSHCRQSDFGYHRKVMKTVHRQGRCGHTHPQEYFSRDVEDICWDKFDIVIAYDLAVPSRIVKRHPLTLWAYCITEPCMPSYRKSRRSPLAHYDVFLNQRFPPIGEKVRNRPHVINCPFNIQYLGCFEELFGDFPQPVIKNRIFVESHTASRLSRHERCELERIAPLSTVQLDTYGIIKNLRESKYFVRFGGRRLWGNAMIEAVASGAYALGPAGEFKNRGLFTQASHVTCFRELVRRLKEFEDCDTLFEAELAKQRKLLNSVAFSRPVAQLLKKWELKTGGATRSGRSR